MSSGNVLITFIELELCASVGAEGKFKEELHRSLLKEEKFFHSMNQMQEGGDTVSSQVPLLLSIGPLALLCKHDSHKDTLRSEGHRMNVCGRPAVLLLFSFYSPLSPSLQSSSRLACKSFATLSLSLSLSHSLTLPPNLLHFKALQIHDKVFPPALELLTLLGMFSAAV